MTGRIPPLLVFSSLAAMSACWVVAGVDDRSVTRTDEPDGAGCPNVFPVPTTGPCQACLHSSCCEELAACAADERCLDCLHQDYYTSCVFPQAYAALKSCAHAACGAAPDAGELGACGSEVIESLGPPWCPTSVPDADGGCAPIGGFFGHTLCNPITNEPCDSARAEACDIDGDTLVFACHAVGRVVLPCKPCGLMEGLCVHGSTCANGQCYRYCCADEDCGPGGICQEVPLPGSDGGGLCVGP